VSAHMSDSKNFEVLTAEPVRLAHSPARRVRTWSREEKTRIVTETFAPGANVSAIARSHGLDPSQVYAWRRQALESGMVAPLAEARMKPVKFTRFDAVSSDMVEIIVGDVVVRAGGDVAADRLAAVIRAVRAA
jgi:transposase